MSTSIKSKLRRLHQGKAPRVLDLFAGCGGMSLGFQRAGCEIIAGLENDPVRAATHAYNFHRHLDPERYKAHAKSRDVAALSPQQCLREITGASSTEIDIIIGGPPCQAYARVGRAKLREIAKRPDAYLHDPRGQLYAAYISYVEAFQPVAVVIENVPDILSYGGTNIGQLIAESLESIGYQCRYTLLNAACYGVPQTRERWYLIGIHQAANALPSFPKPRHHVKLPIGYKGTRSHALRWNDEAPLNAVPLTEPSENLPDAITCEGALSDLPAIPEHIKLAQKRGGRNLAQRQPYQTEPQNNYQRLMRTWPGYQTGSDVSSQVIRALPRDYAIFRRMAPGDDYPAARKIAMDLFAEKLTELHSAGIMVSKNSAPWRKLLKSIVPPYNPDKFPNKWRKMERTFPSRTLLAHLSHDSYSHIHYDDEQSRTISVREAARLQSIPDGFEFCGAMNSAFGQIGNAVPPLMAAALADEVLKTLGANASHSHTSWQQSA
ncbi:DNA cytosine methyltransferase [Corallococcus sp. AB004]|nr:DNA cytosine methyltransferase [Corallococcus sp. AB004]